MEHIIERIKSPVKIGHNVFIADNATVFGDVTLGDNVSIWYNAVLRGDVDKIVIGDNSNVQDGSIIHVTKDKYPTIIGNGVTIGHAVKLHGCVIHDNVLVGIGAIILDGAIINKNCIIAAGTLIPPRKVIPEGSMVMGSPAKIVRQLTEEDFEVIRQNAIRYVNYTGMYRELHMR